MLHNLDWSGECLFAANAIGAGKNRKMLQDHISELLERQD